MKKALIIFMILLIPLAYAIMPIPQENIFSQNQYYSVNFDGEGEATVVSKIELQNMNSESMENFQIEIPGEKVRMLYALQEYYTYSEYCAEWGPDKKCVRKEKRRDWPPKYKVINYQIQPTSSSIIYSLQLPIPINSTEKSSIILYYKSEDYVTKTLGVYSFDFETIKHNYDTNLIRVSISVNPELYLKEGSTKTDYRSNFVSFEKAAAAMQDVEIQRFVGSIGYGGYVETTQGLDPLESFHVKGTYSSSRLNLYKYHILGGILSLIILFYLLYFLLFKKLKKASKKNINLKSMVAGIIASIFLMGLWLLTSYFIEFISRNIYYRYTSLVLILSILIVSIISLVFIFGPAIYFIVRHGWVPSAIYAVSLLISLIIFGVIAIFILSLMNQVHPPIYKAVAEIATIS